MPAHDTRCVTRVRGNQTSFVHFQHSHSELCAHAAEPPVEVPAAIQRSQGALPMCVHPESVAAVLGRRHAERSMCGCSHPVSMPFSHVYVPSLHISPPTVHICTYPCPRQIISTHIGSHIPSIDATPTTTCACKRFKIDAFGDHICTCASHSGAQRAHDWAVSQLANRTTHSARLIA